MAEKYRIKRPQGQQGISRSWGQNANQAGPYHTIRMPQDQAAYDPWADWFNAGLDPEPFADHFAVDPEVDHTPLYFAESPDLSTPWFFPQEMQHHPEEPETSLWQAQPEDPGAEVARDDDRSGPQNSQHDQDNQGQRPSEAPTTPDFIEDSSLVREEEPSATADENAEETREVVAVRQLDQAPPKSETIQAEDEEKTKSDAVKRIEQEKALKAETEKGEPTGKNREPLVWKAFPEKSC